MERLISGHGPVVKVRMLSRQMVIVADPDAARLVLSKSALHAFPVNANANLMHADLRGVDSLGVVFQNGNKWRTLRNAWQTGFNAQSLPGYQPIMDRVALELVARLADAATASDGDSRDATGGSAGAAAPGRREVDIHHEVSKVALEIVGEAGFGVNLNGPEYDKSAYSSNGKPGSMSLMDALRLYFRTITVGEGTAYGLLVILTSPLLMPLVRLLANAYPDKKLARHAETRRVLRQTSERLLDAYRLEQQQKQLQLKTSIGAPSPLLQPAGSLRRQPSLLPSKVSIGGLAPVLETKASMGGHPLMQTKTGVGASRVLQRNGSSIGRGTPVGTGGLLRSLSRALSRAGSRLGRSRSGRVRGVASGSFIGLMLEARDKVTKAALSEDEVLSQAAVFMLAGYETSATAMAAIIYQLALHPEAAAKVALEVDAVCPALALGQEDDMDVDEAEPLTTQHLDQLVYLQAVIDETLRLMPPAPYTVRVAEKNMQVLGYDVPAGTMLYIAMHQFHKNSSIWQDAEAFRPERFLPGADVVADGAPKNPFAFQPFGGGPRMCPGFRFAQQEMKTVLARLYQRYKVELAPGQKVPLPTLVGLSATPSDGLMVRLRPRA